MPTQMLTADLALPAPVLVVEDNPLVRNRLQGLLQQLGYSSDALVMAGSLAQARAYLAGEAHTVSLVLVDLGLPDGSGIELIEELHAQAPNLPMLVVSAWSTQEMIWAALRAGAVGYVLKERDDMEMAMALRSVLRGGAPIDPFIARRIIEELPLQAPPAVQAADDPGLSAREHTILHLVVEGLRLPSACFCRATRSSRISRMSTASCRCPRAPRQRRKRAGAAWWIEPDARSAGPFFRFPPTARPSHLE
jgi:DNA-binding NarL/FixJ family response regulator